MATLFSKAFLRTFFFKRIFSLGVSNLLVVLCVAIFLFDKGLGQDSFLYRKLLIEEPAPSFLYQGASSPWEGIWPTLLSFLRLDSSKEGILPMGGVFLAKVREGEIWRLFTPCLLHRDLLHLLFNMSWLYFLGNTLEKYIGKGKLLLLFFFVAFLSSLAQYVMTGPYFLGFSGVVYGMLGFVWKVQRQQKEPFIMRGLTLPLLLGFLVLPMALELLQLCQCLLWVTGPYSFANTAHTSGLIGGILLAHLEHRTLVRVET